MNKELKKIINDFCLYNISRDFYCGSKTIYDEERNETYCEECGICL